MRLTGFSRVLAVAVVSAAGTVKSAAGQFPEEAVLRTVVADGVATNVVTLGLEERDPAGPALIMFSGAVTRLETWASWSTEIRHLAPMVIYDRPGIGNSEYDERELRPDDVSRHLDALLFELDVPPPYVLVGHSWGGPLMLYYAGHRGSDVVGMLYLDPSNPRETTLEMWGAETSAQLDELQALQREAIEETTAGGERAEADVLTWFQATPVEGRGLPADPEVPTAVVVGMPSMSPPPGAPDFWTEEYGKEWVTERAARLTRWVASMPHATLYFAPGAGHFVHNDAPWLATRALEWVISEIRQGSVP